MARTRAARPNSYRVQKSNGANLGFEVIEEYPEDTPYPSRLILGWRGSRPLHLVIAYNIETRETIVVTVYEPEPGQWEPGFRKRRSS